MPTVLRISGFRFFFYSNEGSEPPHIHVESADGNAKLWLILVKIAKSTGYSERELNRLQQLVAEHQQELTAAWHEFFQ